MSLFILCASSAMAERPVRSGGIGIEGGCHGQFGLDALLLSDDSSVCELKLGLCSACSRASPSCTTIEDADQIFLARHLLMPSNSHLGPLHSHHRHLHLRILQPASVAVDLISVVVKVTYWMVVASSVMLLSMASSVSRWRERMILCFGHIHARSIMSCLI